MGIIPVNINYHKVAHCIYDMETHLNREIMNNDSDYLVVVQSKLEELKKHLDDAVNEEVD